MRRAPVLLLCAALAACGDLPRPFEPAEKAARARADAGPVVWGSVLVRPVEGVPAPLATALAERTVEALLAREVPASARAGSRGGAVLHGQVGIVSGRLNWTLRAPGGRVARRFHEPRPDKPWREATASEVAAVGERAAAQVTAALASPRLAAPEAPATATVALGAVRGAPGDGGPALARAMRDSLARLGVDVLDAPGAAAPSLAGRVAVAPGGGAADDVIVTIAWEVRGPDGAEIGTITQSNREPAARLSGAWGPLAELVARAGAPAVAGLLQRIPPQAQPRTASAEVAESLSPGLAAIEAPLALPAQAAPRAVAAEAVESPPLGMAIKAPLALPPRAAPRAAPAEVAESLPPGLAAVAAPLALPARVAAGAPLAPSVRVAARAPIAPSVAVR